MELELESKQSSSHPVVEARLEVESKALRAAAHASHKALGDPVSPRRHGSRFARTDHLLVPSEFRRAHMLGLQLLSWSVGISRMQSNCSVLPVTSSIPQQGVSELQFS